MRLTPEVDALDIANKVRLTGSLSCQEPPLTSYAQIGFI